MGFLCSGLWDYRGWSHGRVHTARREDDGEYCIESKKYQRDPCPMVIHPKKEGASGLQRFRAEYTHVVRASQAEHGAMKKRWRRVLMMQPGRPKNAATKETLVPACLGKSLKDSCHSDLSSHVDEVDCETQLKQALCLGTFVAVATASPSTTKPPLTKPQRIFPSAWRGDTENKQG